MKCPNCGRIDDNAKVVDSRPYKQTIRRRRECSQCKERWNTYEVTEAELFGLGSKAETRKKEDSKNQWTEEQMITLVKMSEEGKKNTEITKVLGKSKQAVWSKKKRMIEDGKYLKIAVKFEKITEGAYAISQKPDYFTKDWYIEQKENKRMDLELASEMGVNVTTLRKWKIEIGIASREWGIQRVSDIPDFFTQSWYDEQKKMRKKDEEIAEKLFISRITLTRWKKEKGIVQEKLIRNIKAIV